MISIIPDSIGQLEMNRNNISKLPDTLRNLTRLDQLILT
jgi:hypothetical protein